MEDLPVIIAGAGPCGMMSALVLQRHGISSIILERAGRDKLLADVGSGYDIQPTAMKVINYMGLPYPSHFHQYAGIHQLRLDTAATVRILAIKHEIAVLGEGFEAWSAQRSELQKMLSQALNSKYSDLRCGCGVKSFEEEEDRVKVELADGSTVMGRALLACDGVKSAVRAQLYKDQGDILQYCGVRTWWGKTEVAEGSHLHQLMRESQPLEEGLNFCWYMPAGASKGCFMGAPSCGPEGTKFFWAYSCSDPLPPGEGEDLTRRGGVVGPEAKDALGPMLEGACEFARECVAAALPEHVTMVGLYDRARLDLPFTSKGGLVALLGDAAHPQTPFLGQGASSALVDAFVCCARLAHSRDVRLALRAYDSEERRAGMKTMVQEARKWALISTSDRMFTRFSFRQACAWLPLRWIILDMMKQDKTNADFFLKVTMDFPECGHSSCSEDENEEDD
eukprot:CAMPEP_0206458400 /NCGR_PEP_ID=MMETSP0324_2-20121206/23546_1 /ASSEMBLY_ACC=CAM_ASM_000836 /TAXON_ID=2866 /ORGANISM="Crypthecodinium cohnii, Strain Seligo" /LENGTH=450 /DNA_ID=CAMNT_0053929729 /DNA_START=126 /DNA_END=1478 /DNA_ORIENTATION=+